MKETYTGRNTDITLKLQRKISQELKKHMNKKDITMEGSEIVNSTKVATPTAFTSSIRSRESLRENYEILLQGKVKDKHMKEKVVEYAELMIQPRTFCNCKLYDNKKEIAEIKIICCLPEHGNHFSNYWINRTIESNTFATLVKLFAQEMKRYNISNVLITRAPTERAKITSIDTIYTFA